MKNAPSVISWSPTLESEDDYNLLYLGESQYLVLHKILVQGIEICDVMKWDDNKLHLFHVKKGFNNSLRDLAAQIYMSARLVAEAKETGDFSFITELYSHLLASPQATSQYMKKIVVQVSSLSEQDLRKMFSDLEIEYCMAILDTASTPRDIRNPDSFNSNIVKFSLVELDRSMRDLHVPLNIAQISNG